MSEEAMRKHYEKTPKETLIKILVASRKEVEKLQNRNKERKQEIERLHSIIKRLEKELFGMYVDIAGWDEDYAKKLIKTIEDSSQECELLKNDKKDVSIKSYELKCQFSDIWEYGDR